MARREPSARSFDDNGDFEPMAEINVTPMVDVMLVPLIIFMVAAPLMIAGVPVNLPQTAAPSRTRAKSRSSSPSPPMLNITFAMRPV